MKAISVMQPWALLLVCGAKVFETRTWRTNHRGPLFIHASQSFPDQLRELCSKEPFRSLLQAQGIRKLSELPLGALVGTVEIVDCIDADALAGSLSDQDLALGDFSPGRWAWKLTSAERLPAPIPCKGNRGLFAVNPADNFQPTRDP